MGVSGAKKAATVAVAGVKTVRIVRPVARGKAANAGVISAVSGMGTGRTCAAVKWAVGAGVTVRSEATTTAGGRKRPAVPTMRGANARAGNVVHGTVGVDPDIPAKGKATRQARHR